LSELDASTMKNYMKKAKKQAVSISQKPNVNKDDMKKFGNRVKGVSMAQKKLGEDQELEEGTFKVDVEGLPTMYIDGSSAGTIKAQMRKKFKDPKAVVNVERITSTEKKQELRAKMSEEDLNELDKKTMGSYVKKAVNDLDNRSFTQGMRDNSPKYTSADAKNNAKIRARRTGIDRAVNKMSEDQAAIDAYLKKGGKITKVPPAKAQGAHGDTSMASGVAGQLSKADTSRFKTQKKIKSMEDVEQVDEISSELASRAHSSARKQVDYKKTTPTTAKKSDQGTKVLAYHQRKAVNPSHTGTSYKGSPGGTDVAAAYKSSSEPARKTSGKYIDKLKKQGIDVSEEQVDEISKRAKAAYTRVAARDLHHQGSRAAQGVANNDREAIKKADRNINNRLQGIDRATKSLQKEGAMKRIATQDAEKERLGPKVKGSGLDTFKKKPSNEAYSHAGTSFSMKAMSKMKPQEKEKPKKESVNFEEKDTHVTKDGRTVKKGLWYNMNKRKEDGTSRPKSAGTVSPEAIKKSQIGESLVHGMSLSDSSIHLNKDKTNNDTNNKTHYVIKNKKGTHHFSVNNMMGAGVAARKEIASKARLHHDHPFVKAVHNSHMDDNGGPKTWHGVDARKP